MDDRRGLRGPSTGPGARARAFVGSLCVVALTLGACGTTDEDGGAAASTTTTVATSGHVSETYATEEWWLCSPEKTGNPCVDSDLTATAIARDLTQSPAPFEPATDPPVDCFYVYPTVHLEGGPNRADPADTSAEQAVVRDEAARFSEVCDVYAPLYPQSTTPAGTSPDPATSETAYASVRDAFLHYLDQLGSGRRFVVVGHGQGADLLTRLVREELEPHPDRLGLLLSAMLVGATGVVVPEGQPVGGTFASVPLCTGREHIGCVIAFHAYQLGVPPPSGVSPLYPAPPPGMVTACTNPSGLDGSKGQFRGAYFPAAEPGLPPVPTPYALYREYYRGECASRSGGVAYVAVDVVTDPNETRPLGPVASAPGQEAGLGLHTIELELALGDLLALVEEQTATAGG